MKDCFGIHFGFMFEDKVTQKEDRSKCYNCDDFDKCFKIALIRSLEGIKVEIRNGVRGLRNSLGGSHKEFPFG